MENSILQIKQTIENLNYNIYEYSKYNDEKYKEMLDKQSNYEQANLDYVQNQTDNILNTDNMYSLRDDYNKKTKKDYTINTDSIGRKNCGCGEIVLSQSEYVFS